MSERDREGRVPPLMNPPQVLDAFETLQLITSSIRDIVFSRRAPQTHLTIRPGVPHSKTTDMEEHSQSNGVNGGKASKFDPNFTSNVINATGPKATPRMRKVIASLIRHAHDFCRENEVTMSEFMAGVDMVWICFDQM